jgi:hypothetical protein
MRVRRFVSARADRFIFSVGFGCSLTQRSSVVRAKKRVRENCITIADMFLNARSGRKRYAAAFTSPTNADSVRASATLRDSCYGSASAGNPAVTRTSSEITASEITASQCITVTVHKIDQEISALESSVASPRTQAQSCNPRATNQPDGQITSDLRKSCQAPK